MPRGDSKPGERRGGRKKGTPNKLPKGERALVKLDAAEAEVRALKAEGLPLDTLGKDRLSELDAWAHSDRRGESWGRCRRRYTQQGLRPAGGEPWRGHAGGVDESFFWGGSTGKRAW
jgi:hypothetical protein